MTATMTATVTVMATATMTKTARTMTMMARTTTMKAATATVVVAAFRLAAAMVMLVGCCSLPLVAWHLYILGIISICLGINLFWSKFYSGCPDTPNRIYSIRIYSRFIPILFLSKFGYKLLRTFLAVTQYLFIGEVNTCYVENYHVSFS
jgi:hypothetical protein